MLTAISYTEFSYQILQANDYLELHNRYECTLQLGGSDQWGNLVSGVDLIRRVTGDSVHALATPLITKPDGTKYGKTEGGAYLNNQRVTDEKAVPGPDDLLYGRYLILRRGKRTVGAVEVVPAG